MKELTFEAVQACKSEDELWALLTEECGWASPRSVEFLEEQNDELSEDLSRLRGLLNTPETTDFIKGVKYESGHQRWRWGDGHDMRKTAGEWFWTLGYLAQKQQASIGCITYRHVALAGGSPPGIDV